MDYRKYQPFFTRRRTFCNPGGCRVGAPCWPRDIDDGSIETLVGEYAWQLSSNNRHSRSGGSKIRAYRMGRGRVVYNKAYLNQYYSIFAGPIGILP